MNYYFAKYLKNSMDQTVRMYNLKGCVPGEVAEDIVADIASICYKPKRVNKEKLYNQLYKESLGLPSTSFEFVPIAVTVEDIKKWTWEMWEYNHTIPAMAHYGYEAENGMWITNLRAFFTDTKGTLRLTDEKAQEILFTPVTTNCILFKIDGITMYTLGQLVRHREASLQVMSRRYVSSERKLHEVFQHPALDKEEHLTFTDGVDGAFRSYNKAIAAGVKKEVARGLLPQCSTTELWWKPTSPASANNFLELRTAKSAQDEIRALANTIKEISQGEYNE